MWTKRLNGAGPARGQRGYTLPTARPLAHMPTALGSDREDSENPHPIHCLCLQRIDAPRVPKVRPLQAHTSFGKDCRSLARDIHGIFARSQPHAAQFFRIQADGTPSRSTSLLPSNVRDAPQFGHTILRRMRCAPNTFAKNGTTNQADRYMAPSPKQRPATMMPAQAKRFLLTAITDPP